MGVVEIKVNYEGGSVFALLRVVAGMCCARACVARGGRDWLEGVISHGLEWD